MLQKDSSLKQDQILGCHQVKEDKMNGTRSTHYDKC